MDALPKVLVRWSSIVVAIPLMFSRCDSAVEPERRMDQRAQSSNSALAAPLIATPVSVGTQQGYNHNGSITFTVGSGGVPEDVTLFVDYAVYANDSGTSVSVADVGGNVYVADWQESDHTGGGGHNALQWGRWRARMATALGQGSAITISGFGTGPANRRFRGHAYYVEGLAEDPLIDVSVSGADQDPSGDITASPEAIFLGSMYTRCLEPISADPDFSTISAGGQPADLRQVRLRTSYRIIGPAPETRGYDAIQSGPCTKYRLGISAYQAEQTGTPSDNLAELYNLPAQVVEGQSYDLRARLLDGATGDVVEEYDAANWSFSVESGPATVVGVNHDVLAIDSASAPDSVTVRATYSAGLGTPSDTETVSVVPAAATNEPVGMTLIGSNDGSVKESNGDAWGIASFGPWQYRPGISSSQIAVVNDPTNPVGSGQSVQFIWPAASIGGATANSLMGGPYRELYVRFRIFMEPGGWNFGHKFFYSYGENGASMITDRPSGQNPEKVRIVMAGSIIDSANPTYGSTGAIPRPLVLGQWVTLEFHYRTSSGPGAGDGFGRIWADGVLVAARDNLQTSMTTFTRMEWYASANSVPTVSTYRVGELHISGRN